MKCPYCEAGMVRGSVPFHVDRKGIHITFDDIPAWVCPQCGESCFEEREVDYMQAVIKAVEEQNQRFAKTA